MERRTETDAGRICLKAKQENTGGRPTNPSTSTATATFQETFDKFTENRTYIQDRFEYPRHGSEPGLVLIFNQETFENGSEQRNGTFKDVEDIVTCLNRLGFNINPNHIFTNLSDVEIFNNIDSVLAKDLSEVNSVLVFVLTHGENSNFLQSRTASFLADNLWLKFVNCRDLEGKPKMFVIQACKGDKCTTLSTNDKNTLLVPLSTFSSQRIFPDLLIVYSTMEGRFAYRDNICGAWLIQELCKNFTAYGRRDDVLTIFSRIIKCLCKNYFDTEGNVYVKQIPVIVSTLSKKFYLNNNKDRNFILTSIEKHNELLAISRSISEKISSIHGIEDDRKNGRDK